MEDPFKPLNKVKSIDLDPMIDEYIKTRKGKSLYLVTIDSQITQNAQRFDANNEEWINIENAEIVLGTCQAATEAQAIARA